MFETPMQEAVLAADLAFVTVHAYTPRAVHQAVEAGVLCIEHGHLIDDPAKHFIVIMRDGKIYKNLLP